MLDALLQTLPLMLLGTQLLLTLILIKAEICPGQRGRLHKILPGIGTLWLASSMAGIEALLVGCCVFYFYSKVQTKKTNKQGPLWVMHLANIMAMIFVVYQLIKLSSATSVIAGISAVFVLGSVFAHLNLKMAASRLESFHKILPVTGIVATMVFLLSVSMQVVHFSDVQISAASVNIFAGLAALIIGILIWCLHMIRSSDVQKVQLSLSCLLILGAYVSFQPLLLI